MKTILARLQLFAFILGVLPAITLSGCGVRGPLYYPKAPPAPQKPAQDEPTGVLWPNATPTNPSPSNQ